MAPGIEPLEGGGFGSCSPPPPPSPACGSGRRDAVLLTAVGDEVTAVDDSRCPVRDSNTRPSFLQIFCAPTSTLAIIHFVESHENRSSACRPLHCRGTLWQACPLLLWALASRPPFASVRPLHPPPNLLPGYPDLLKTKKDLQLLNKLYSLYITVIQRMDSYANLLWIEFDYQKVTEEVLQFQVQVKHMPRQLRSWEAYAELRKNIDDFLDLLPLLQQLCHSGMRERHWTEVMRLLGVSWSLDPEVLCFALHYMGLREGAQRDIDFGEKTWGV